MTKGYQDSSRPTVSREAKKKLYTTNDGVIYTYVAPLKTSQVV